MDQLTSSGIGVTKRRVTLLGWGIRAISIQGLLLVSAAFLLPAAAHLTGLPVRLLLPMHWPVILVGLCYGWRSGLLVGVAAPGLSYLLSGMPYPAMLPAMTVELAAYGFLAGFFRGQLRWSALLSTGLAVVGGRLVFIAMVILPGAIDSSLPAYIKVAILPGLAAGLAQLLLLPPAAEWWVSREGKK